MLKKMIMTALAVPMLFLTGGVMKSPSAHAACVVGVKSNDVLWIRKGPSRNAIRVGRIPSAACGVKVRFGKCVGPWCRVRYRGVRGWSHTRFLTARGPSRPVMKRCKPVIVAFAEGKFRPVVRTKALARWTNRARRRHGFKFANWVRAENRSSKCKRSFNGKFWICRVKARPCRKVKR